MKAIIPVAGAGIRLRPHTYTQPKPLIPVAGKPILGFLVDQLVEAGIRDFVFIIGYLGEKLQVYLEQEYPDLHKTFVTQANRLGSAHALYTARETFSDEEDLVIVFGDTIIDLDMRAFLDVPGSCLAVKKVKDPRDVGIVETDAGGIAVRVVEKPVIPKSNLAMVGLYKIAETRALRQALSDLFDPEVRTSGEFPLTEALMAMIRAGILFRTMEVDNWFDCGKKEVLLETNAMMLKRSGAASPSSEGIDNSIIIPPVHIGEGCHISHSIIGPNVSIGSQVRIISSMIRDSIVGHFAHLEDVVLDQSIVGNDASIHGPRQSLNTGDNTEIDFG